MAGIFTRETILKLRQSGHTYSMLGVVAERSGVPPEIVDVFRTGGRYWGLGDTGGVFYPYYTEHDEPEQDDSDDE
jgi:hypothetical protein